MKKVFKQWFIVAAALLMIFLHPMDAGAIGSRTTQIDAILLIDDSGSMKNSDPKQISIQAVSRFIDLCQIAGDKVSVVVYGDKIIRQTNLKEITSLDDKQALKNISMGTPRSSWTDIGVGLKRAIEIMDNGHDKNHKPIIILLSDGKNMPQRNIDQAEADKNNAVSAARDKGYRIYTIGLNADGTVDKDELSSIASSTNGKFYSTEKADNLGEILNDIFADAVGSNTVTTTPLQGSGIVDINIPNSNVVEANITIVPQDPNDFSFSLVDPDGKVQPIDNNHAYLSKNATYTMIKLISPKMGTWKLNIDTGKDKVTNVSLLYNYDIQLALEVSPGSGVHKGDKVKINSYLISNGSRIVNADALYKGVDAKLIVTNENQHDVKEMPLTNTGNSFEGEFQFNDNANYTIISKIETQTFFRESNPVNIAIENRPPVVSKKISSKIIHLSKNPINMILSGFFTDPDGDKLTYSISVVKPDIAVLAVDGDNLKIDTKKTGSINVIVSANDGRGGVVEMPLSIRITSILGLILLIIGIILAIAIIIVLFIMRKRANRRFAGEMKIVVRDDNTGKVSPPQYRRLDNYRGKVNLHQLLQLKPEYMEAEKLVFIPGREDSLIVKNSSACMIQRSGRNLDSSRGIELKDRDNITINLTKVHESISIEYYIS